MKKQTTKTERTILTVLIYLSLLSMMVSQVSHTVALFIKLAPNNENKLFAYCFAGAFDISIAIFIMLGKKAWAIIASAFMLFINLLYYSNKIQLPEIAQTVAAAIIISFIMAAMIISYSWLIHEQNEAVETPIIPEPKKRGRPYKIKVTTI